MNRKLKNNKGSTLLLLVIAMAVISILGTSVLGATMMNLKIKKTNTESKKSFYLSESGLDKAYNEAYNLVIDAINISNNDTQIFLQELIKQFKNGEIDEIDENEIHDRAKSQFTKYFYEYINDSLYLLEEDSQDLKVTIESLSYIDNEPYNEKNAGDVLNIDIKSQSNLNGIDKTTSVLLSIEIPKYNMPYKVSSSTFSSNSLFSNNVLTAKQIVGHNNVEYVPEDGFYIYDDLNFNIKAEDEIYFIDGEFSDLENVLNLLNDGGQHRIIIITNEKIGKNEFKVKNSLNLSGLLISNGGIAIKGNNSDININGIIVSGDKFDSDNNAPSIKLTYDDLVVNEIINEINDPSIKENIYKTINEISRTIYNKNIKQNKITVKNSAEINSGENVSDLITFSNWRNK